jgi:hypothetical protein
MKLPIILAITITLLSAQPKEALLIGNSHYQHISNLNNPSTNLNRLKRTLEDLDFNVKIKTDLDDVHLEESIEVFAKRLARSRDTIGFLYYTGHGCQVAHQGYLLPTNVDSQDRLKVKHHALNINEMIERLKDAGNRVNMFFLDACRDVPTSTKGGSKGLGQIKNTPKGTLVVYATKAGEVAEDNSDFINSIIKSIKEPNQNIRNLPYSISDRFTQMSTSQMPIFSAVGIPKVVFSSCSLSPQKDLVGKWYIKDKMGKTIIFNDDHSVKIVQKDRVLDDFFSIGGKVTWELDENKEPMHLDLVINSNSEKKTIKILMIVKFIGKDKLQIQMGKPPSTRPIAFSKSSNKILVRQ